MSDFVHVPWIQSSLLNDWSEIGLAGMLVGFSCCLVFIRYFLRKLKKVKKSNGQMLAINEVYLLFF